MSVDEQMQAKVDADEDRHYDQKWYATVVLTVYAPDIFKATQEAERLLAANLPRHKTTWGILGMSDRLGDDDE